MKEKLCLNDSLCKKTTCLKMVFQRSAEITNQINRKGFITFLVLKRQLLSKLSIKSDGYTSFAKYLRVFLCLLNWLCEMK